MSKVGLTPYESSQVAEIAAWKGHQPGIARRTLELMKWPVDQLVATVLPADKVRGMLTRLQRAADWKGGRDAIERSLGIDLLSLRDGPLERCDQTASKLKDLSREIITTESLLAGIGGIATELLNLPAEVIFALRSVHRMGACYGYSLDGPQDEALILAIVGLSMLESPEERLRARRLIRKLEEIASPDRERQNDSQRAERRFEEFVDDDLIEVAGTVLFEEKLGEGIPFLGEAIGVVLDARFIAAVEEAAQRTFQERWLREQGKLDEIAPSKSERLTSRTLSEGLSQVTYSTTYAISFGVVFPASLIAAMGVQWLPSHVVEGFVGGADAAARDVGRLWAGVRGRPDPIAQKS